MVVAFHAGLPVPGGFVGVDVFFVISGFVITAMLHRVWTSSGRIRFGTFYWRRFKRLAPALALTAVVTVLISALVLPPPGAQQSATTGMGAMLAVANFVIARNTGGYFDAAAETNPLLNTWSLSVEEQFYLVVPALVALGWYLARRARWFRFSPHLIVGLIALVSFALVLISASGLTVRGVGMLLGFYSPITRAWEFAVGALLALALVRWTPKAQGLMSALGAIGLLMLGASLWLINDANPFPGLWTILPVTGTLLLLLAGTDSTNPSSRALSVGPMVKIGDWSYSIYLWHWPAIVFTGLLWSDSPRILLLGALASLAPALASYRWLEQPLRHLTFRSPKVGLALVAVVVLGPIALASGLYLGAATWWGNNDLRLAYSRTMSFPTGWTDPLCMSRVPVDQRDVIGCQWNQSAPGVPVYLIGDSNAQHFSDGMIIASKELGHPLTTLGTQGCPLIDVHLKRYSDPSLEAECRRAYEALMAWLADQQSGLVVLSASSRYWQDADGYSVSHTDDFSDAFSASNASVLTDGLDRTVRELQAMGHEVLLLQTIPHYLDPQYAISDISSCTGLELLNGACVQLDGTEMPRDFADAWQQGSRLAHIQVAANTGATVFDFRSFFCADDVCRTRIDDIDFYMPDGFHLNISGSRALRDPLAAALRKATADVRREVRKR